MFIFLIYIEKHFRYYLPNSPSLCDLMKVLISDSDVPIQKFIHVYRYATVSLLAFDHLKLEIERGFFMGKI